MSVHVITCNEFISFILILVMFMCCIAFFICMFTPLHLWGIVWSASAVSVVIIFFVIWFSCPKFTDKILTKNIDSQSDINNSTEKINLIKIQDSDLFELGMESGCTTLSFYTENEDGNIEKIEMVYSYLTEMHEVYDVEDNQIPYIEYVESDNSICSCSKTYLKEITYHLSKNSVVKE